MKMTKKQEEEIKAIIDSITEEAKGMIKDYSENPSDLTSGSIVQIHEGSPYIASREERLKTMEGLDKEFDDEE
tara:strand:+ start:311 stop:529 length:219 start_codon:yes stop_codon:yes gene_type:complete